MATRMEKDFLAVVKAKGYMPPYTQQELQRHTVIQLKIIGKYFGMRNSDMRRSKASLVQAVLNHENNKDPEWIREFRRQMIPCPIYTMDSLTRMDEATIDTITASWKINQTLESSAKRLKIFNHIFNQFEIDDDDDGFTELFGQDNNRDYVPLRNEDVFRQLENSGRESRAETTNNQQHSITSISHLS